MKEELVIQTHIKCPIDQPHIRLNGHGAIAQRRVEGDVPPVVVVAVEGFLSVAISMS